MLSFSANAIFSWKARPFPQTPWLDRVTCKAFQAHVCEVQHFGGGQPKQQVVSWPVEESRVKIGQTKKDFPGSGRYKVRGWEAMNEVGQWLQRQRQALFTVCEGV